MECSGKEKIRVQIRNILAENGGPHLLDRDPFPGQVLGQALGNRFIVLNIFPPRVKFVLIGHADPFLDQDPKCYDHALLVTGYDVLLSTLQGNLSFSTSSASSFASTHAGPDHFHLIDLRLRHHALSDSCLEPPSRVLPHGQPRSFDISTPLPLDVTMTYDSDPDSNPD